MTRLFISIATHLISLCFVILWLIKWTTELQWRTRRLLRRIRRRSNLRVLMWRLRRPLGIRWRTLLLSTLTKLPKLNPEEMASGKDGQYLSLWSTFVRTIFALDFKIKPFIIFTKLWFFFFLLVAALPCVAAGYWIASSDKALAENWDTFIFSFTRLVFGLCIRPLLFFCIVLAYSSFFFQNIHWFDCHLFLLINKISLRDTFDPICFPHSNNLFNLVFVFETNLRLQKSNLHPKSFCSQLSKYMGWLYEYITSTSIIFTSALLYLAMWQTNKI